MHFTLKVSNLKNATCAPSVEHWKNLNAFIQVKLAKHLKHVLYCVGGQLGFIGISRDLLMYQNNHQHNNIYILLRIFVKMVTSKMWFIGLLSSCVFRQAIKTAVLFGKSSQMGGAVAWRRKNGVILNFLNQNKIKNYL